MAFSFTADAGCQYGGGITCHGGPNKSSFLGWMGYHRFWWDKDLFAVTLGGGQMNNTGRYLTLLPPIDGAWAAVGSAYFPELPGSTAKMYDGTLTFHYMPKAVYHVVGGTWLSPLECALLLRTRWHHASWRQQRLAAILYLHERQLRPAPLSWPRRKQPAVAPTTYGSRISAKAHLRLGSASW